MTWYAHEIICQPTPEILAELRAHPVLSKGIYWVRDLDDFQWFRPEVRHGLPEDGLVIVRPVSSPQGFEGCYDDKVPILSWHLDSIVTDEKSEAEDQVFNPPDTLKHFLRNLSRKTSSVTAFYQCVMWAGIVDWETSWVYTPEEFIYAHPANAPDAIFAIPEHDHQPLIALLRHFGLYLPTTYFALHTRSFPWARYKVPIP
jgi:hypothetical protein